MRAMKPHEHSAKEVATVYDPAEDYDPTKTIVYEGKRLPLQETRFVVGKLRYVAQMFLPQSQGPLPTEPHPVVCRCFVHVTFASSCKQAS